MIAKTHHTALIALLGGVSTLSAAPITWGPATNVSTVVEVSNTGTTVEAINASHSGVTNTLSLNGVTFVSNVNLLDNDHAGDLFSGDTGDADYNQFLSNFDLGGGTNLVSLTVADGLLTNGNDYQIQVWYVDTSKTRTTPFGDGESPNHTVDVVGGPDGQFAIGTFTAVGTSQTLTLESPGFSNAHITGYQIRSVAGGPPPAFVTPVLDLSGRDVLGLGGGESGGYFASPKSFGPTTDFSLNDVAYTQGGLSGTFDVTFSVTSTMNGIKRGGKGGFGTADSSGGSSLIDIGESISIDSLAISDLQGGLAGTSIVDPEIVAVYLGNETAGDGATINGVAATGAGGGNTIGDMRNDITPASSAVILGTGTGDGYSINGIAIQFGGSPVAPSPTLSTVATSPVSAPFTVDLAFTEDVTGLEESDFLITNGTVTAASLSGSGDTYSIEITPVANGDVEVTLPADSVDDLDGDNAQNTASNTLSLFYLAPGSDYPGVTLSTASPTVSAAYTVDVIFDEAVTGLVDSDFDVTNGTASGLFGSGATYSVLITPAVDGDVTVLLPAEVVTDTDGDNLQNTVSNSLVTTASLPDVPTVQLFGILSSASPSFDIYISFSEEITGLTDSDFEVVNGSVSGTVSTSASNHDSHFDAIQGRHYKATITAASPGPVAITLPAGVVTDTDGDNNTNLLSNTYTTQCTTDFGDKWIIDDQADWTAATGSTSNMTLTANGMVEPTANTAQFSSNAINFPVKRQATFLTLEQSPVWDNWTDAGDIRPSGAGDAPILVSVSNDNYYFLGRSNSVYHAWHSTDMVNWTARGAVTSGTGGRWTTSAEYKDGEFYIYSDDPNDHNPRLFKDSNLDDGVPGTDMGLAFVKDASGSDTAVIRSDETGLFHLISEDWTPLKASSHAWDSPLANHTSSPDGFNGFTAHEHQPPIDLRTTPTGTISSYDHPHIDWDPTYEIHSPEQDAFGDWTAIKIGSRYYLFADYDPAGQSIRLAKFTSGSIYEEFDLLGQVETHDGHPDPTCGFAEGQFYLITQQSTDWVSPGPWVDGVEARAGVDTDGDTVIDQWTTWQTVGESYDHKAGYVRVVEKTPAQLDLSSLAPGYNFEFEFRIDDTVVSGTSPIMDRAEFSFEPDHFQQWANAEGTPATASGDHNSNAIPNLVEFALGQSSLPERLPNGSMSVTTTKDALDDGYSVDLEFSATLLPGSWETATLATIGVKLLSTTTLPNGDEEAAYEIIAPNGTHVFWRIAVQ